MFGEEFSRAAPVLRCLLPIMIFALPNQVLGFPTLGAMGLTKQATRSITFGTIMHIINLIVLFFIGHTSVITLAIFNSVAEGLILAYRATAVIKNKDFT